MKYNEGWGCAVLVAVVGRKSASLLRRYNLLWPLCFRCPLFQQRRRESTHRMLYKSSDAALPVSSPAPSHLSQSCLYFKLCHFVRSGPAQGQRCDPMGLLLFAIIKT
ncbi:hypothetical protein XELAEV_18037940mg [Xenopus laevis]|uniref:Uncharacterized protein n=1 Tax=Xenopus laevis TaxID=8355 RepID=A0A974CE72_XENLA|nr:hypothetical protein XELAEV_18037940mg [Xenopus laevis]